MPESDANEVGVESDGLQKGMEKGEEAAMANPLFAAMASFIGLSTLFAASVLFMPKLGGGRAFDDHHEWARNVLNALDWDKWERDTISVCVCVWLTSFYLFIRSHSSHLISTRAKSEQKPQKQ